MRADWSEFVLVGDPGVGQTITTLHPALSVTFHFHRLDYPAIRQLCDAAMELIKPGLTHYQAEEMKRPAAINARALTMIPTWLRKPRVDHRYWWTANGGDDLGCAPPGLQFNLFTIPATTPEQQARSRAYLLKVFGTGEMLNFPLVSNIRVLLEVDHPLADGQHLLAWLSGLELVKRGSFAFAECGYTLSSLASPFGGEIRKREQVLCSRYPGLDCFRPSHTHHMFRVDPDYPDFVPLVRRAAWTTLLHPLTVAFLGGEEKIREQLAETTEIKVVTLPNGLAIQAGATPQLGDLSRGELLPLQRKVASVLRNARITKPAEESDFWDHFFNIFDKDYP